MILHQIFSIFHDSNGNIFWLTLVYIICAAVHNHKQCCVLQRNIPPFHMTFPTQSSLIPKLRASLKYFFQICRYLLKPVEIESPIILIGAAVFFKRFYGTHVLPASQVCVNVAPAICSFWCGYF